MHDARHDNRWLARGLLVLAASASVGCSDLADQLTVTFTNQTFELDVGTGLLTPRAALSSQHGTTTVVAWPDGTFGAMGTANAQDAVWRYDPASDSWSQRAAWPTPRYARWLQLGDEVCAGSDSDSGPPLLECYAPASDSWSVKATPPVYTSASLVHEGRLYAFDGLRDKSDPGTKQAAVYDPSDDSWTALPDKPPCNAVAAVEHRGQLEVFCYDDDFNGSTPRRAYDPQSDSWSEGSIDETFGHDPAAPIASVGDHIFVDDVEVVTPNYTVANYTLEGGRDGIPKSMAVFGDTLVVLLDRGDGASVVWLYDATTDTWTEGETIPFGTFSGAHVRMAANEDRAFVFVSALSSVGIGG